MNYDGTVSGRDSDSATEPRDSFTNRAEAVLYCMGLAVGIGSVWRFPILVYQYGGGAFVLAYVILMIILGIPLYTLELSIGQFSSQGPVGIWGCVPIAKGIGYAMVIISLLTAIYYNVILAYTLYYLVQSFQSTLPWSGCYDWWGADKDLCFVRYEDVTFCKNVPKILFDKYATSNLTGQTVPVYYEKAAVAFNAPLTEFTALMGIGEVGGLKWDLVACLFVSWVIVFLCLIRGVTSSGKVVYFTATFPYVVLIILLVKGVTLDGAMRGLEYLFIPDFVQLKSITLWRKAAEQLFFALNVSFGGLIMSGSYNNFRTGITRDALIVVLAVFGTSMLGGVAIFSVLGYMSETYGIPIEEAARPGQGLAFVVYPEALTTFSCPQLWSVTFFVMLYLLGIDSEFPFVQVAVTAVSDAFPVLRRHKALTAFVTCAICFLLGLTCVARGGQYVLNLLDTYCAGVSVLIISTFEVAAIMWIYGVNRFSADVKFMLGKRPNILIRLSWVLISPVILVSMVVYYFYDWAPITYNNKEPYPVWADNLGLGFIALSVIQVPIAAIFVLCKKKSIVDAFQPDEKWGPDDELLLREYKHFTGTPKDFELTYRGRLGST